MLLVGLTGGIASGKSTVSAMLAERGAEIIDADRIAREIVMPGLPAWCKIREHFGREILFADGTIDRQALADIVFADPAKLALLNEITHPPIFERIAERLEDLAPKEVVVVLDAALLLESTLGPGTDLVVVVHSPKEIQLERLAAKGMEPGHAEARIGAQLDPAERLNQADVVIDNDGSVEDLGRQVDELWDDLQRRLAATRSQSGAQEQPGPARRPGTEPVPPSANGDQPAPEA
jgi:dephospho-CoA kinase